MQAMKSNDDWWMDPLALFEDEDEPDDSYHHMVPPTTSRREAHHPHADPADLLLETILPEEPYVHMEEAPPPSQPHQQQHRPANPSSAPQQPPLWEDSPASALFEDFVLEDSPYDEPEPPEPMVSHHHPRRRRGLVSEEPVAPTTSTTTTTLPTRMPAADAASSRRSTSLPHRVTAASPLLLTLLPKVRALCSSHVATTSLLVFTAGKALLNWTLLRRDRSTCRASLSSSEDEEDLEEDDVPHPDGKRDARSTHGPPNASRRRSPEEETDRPRSVRGGGWFGGLFRSSSDSSSTLGDSPTAKPSRPPLSRAALSEALEDWQRRAEDAEADKQTMEREYEKASWQLQETLSELTSLQTTTRHLQAQLTDNEEMLARAIRSERRKAKEELLRMKEAMVKVVEREREAMRDEFMKQAAELQVLWKQKEEAAAAAAAGASHDQQGSTPPPQAQQDAPPHPQALMVPEPENTHAV